MEGRGEENHIMHESPWATEEHYEQSCTRGLLQHPSIAGEWWLFTPGHESSFIAYCRYLDFRMDQLWRFTKRKLCITSATHWHQYEESLAQFFSHCFRYLWKVELRSVPSCAAQIPNKGTCFFFIAFFSPWCMLLSQHICSPVYMENLFSSRLLH